MKPRTSVLNPFQTEIRSAPFTLDAPKFRTVSALRSLGKQSRTAIGELITYSPSKMTSVVNDLIGEGILEEVGEEASTGGRKARAIDFNPNFGYIAAATIEPTRFDVALVDFSANIRVRRIIPLPENTSPQNILNLICEFLLERLDKLQIPHEKIFGFGLATPSPVDMLTGTICESPQLSGWSGYQVESHLREVFPYAVITLERDVNAIAYGELRRGGRLGKTFIVVKTVDPIGAGIVIDGSVYRGSTGRAGEISPDKLGDDAFSKDLAVLVRFLDPEAIVTAGDGSDSETQFAATLGRHLLEFSSPAQTRRIEPSRLGLEAMMTGLIIRVAENVFTMEVK